VMICTLNAAIAVEIKFKMYCYLYVAILVNYLSWDRVFFCISSL